MKIKHALFVAIFSIIAIFSITSCVDLNYSEVSTNDKAWIYSMPTDIAALVTNVYAFVQYDLGEYNGAMLSSATDESDYALSLSPVHNYYNGAWSPINPFNQTWNNDYQGITQANDFLQQSDSIYASLNNYRYNVAVYSYADLQKEFQLFNYQVRFLRAYFYFELVKTYGDVPLVTKVLTNAEANNVTRTPAADVFKFIVSECDEIADKLPISYTNEPNQETNRINRITVLALKARALLYEASPLFNTTNDPNLWAAAAAANKAVIDFAAFSGVTLGKYSNLSGANSYTDNEIFWIRATGVPDQYRANSVESFNFPIGVENGHSGNCPTQNLVDAYEYQSGPNAGKSFGSVWSDSTTINLTADNPYANLDPRFGMTVAKNGDVWPSYTGSPLQIYEGGANASPIYGATQTGYYLKKLCDPNANISTNNPNPQRHNFILFRLAEFYLNYAEAIYHVTGSSDDPGTFGMSANDAINVLRDRPDVMMPHFTGNDPNFLQRYMRERMIELAFEDQRFWDVRRWKLGPDFFSTIETAALQQAPNGTITMTRGTMTRGWNDKYYFYPIPYTEIQKNPKLTQNPGW